jgi:hypothetical protein
LINIADIKSNDRITVLMEKANNYLGAMGAIVHDERHANQVSDVSYEILASLGFDRREAELAAIAGYLHDIGNVVTRYGHGPSGGILAYYLLTEIGMPPEEIAVIISAIGNHEEHTGNPVNNVSAAVILADKCDVDKSRVRKRDVATFTTRDRVNFAVRKAALNVEAETRKVVLSLTIDTEICSVMDYFEIFMAKMLLCRRAASFLNSHFELVINGAKLI